MKIFHTEHGFTLVEMLVTIGIMSTLAIASFSAITGATDRSKLAQLASNINDVKRISLTYRADIGQWPPKYPPAPNPFITQPPGVTNWRGPYIQQYPEHHPWRGNIGFISDSTNCAAVIVYDDQIGNTGNANLLVPTNIRDKLDSRFDNRDGAAQGIVRWGGTYCGITLGANEIAILILD